MPISLEIGEMARNEVNLVLIYIKATSFEINETAK